MAAEKKVALVTGGNKGIGLETVKQLAQQGITVLLGARDAARGEAAAKKLQAEGLDVKFIQLDVVNAKDREAAVKQIEKDYGKLDILINNAGIAGKGEWGQNTTSITSPAELQEVFNTNFFSVVALTQELLPLIRKSAAGRIVNLSSILGSNTLHASAGSPIENFKQFSYDASKTALNAFTIHLAHELKDTKIKVNSAHPGWVKTDMGTDAAPMEVPDGAKTSVQLATLESGGPNGGYFHLGETLPW